MTIILANFEINKYVGLLNIFLVNFVILLNAQSDLDSVTGAKLDFSELRSKSKVCCRLFKL